MADLDPLTNALLQQLPEKSMPLLEQFEPRMVAALLSDLKSEQAAALVRYSHPDFTMALFAHWPDEFVLALFKHLEISQQVFLLRRMERRRRDEVIETLPVLLIPRIRAALNFPPDSAATIADPAVFTLPEDLTCGEGMKRFQNGDSKSLYYIYIIDRENTLKGVLSLKELLINHRDSMIHSVMTYDPVSVPAMMPFSTLLLHQGWRRFHALPVVSEDKIFIGVIRHKTLNVLEDKKQRLGQEHQLEKAMGELYWLGLSGFLFSTMTTDSKSKRHEPE